MKLLHKLILAFSVVVVLSSLTAFFSIQYSRSLLQETFLESTRLQARNVLNNIENELESKIEIFQALSRDIILQEALAASNNQFSILENVQTYIEEIEEAWPSISEEAILNNTLPFLDKNLTWELRQKRDFFKHLYGFEVVGEVFVTNKFGANVAMSGKTSDYKQDDEEWWQRAHQNKLFINDVAYDESADLYSVDFGLAVYDEYNDFIGVIKVVLSLQDLMSAMNIEHEAMHDKYETMFYILTNADGKVLYSTEGHRFFQDVTYLIGGEDQLVPGTVQDEVMILQEVEIQREERKEVLVTHIHTQGFHEYGGLNWILVIKQDADELYAPIKELSFRIALTTLAIALVTISLGLVLATSISRNIRRLRDASIQLGHGDLDVRVRESSGDEIGELSATFNKMAEDLKNTTVSRDSLVEEIKMRMAAEESILDSEKRFRSVAENASDAILYVDSRGEVIFWNAAAEKIFGYTAEEIVGQKVTSLMPQGYRDLHSAGIERLVNNGQSRMIGRTMEIEGLRKDGHAFPLELSLSTWTVRDAIYFTAIIRDVSSRKHTEEIIQKQVGRLSALRSIDQAIIASLDLNVTLDVFLTQILSQLNIDAASILLLNQDTQILEYIVSKGFRSSALKYTRLRLGESHAGSAAIKRHIVTIPDLREKSSGFDNSKLFPDEDFVTYFAVPLIAKGNVKGVLEIFNRSTVNTDPDWMEFLEAIADQGAIALDNATLFADLQRSNIELSLAYDTTIEGWARALDMRDRETEGHSRRVTELTVRIAQEFQIRDDDLMQVRRGALLHDIGKMGIPDNILLKPGKLTEEEWVIMKQHPVYARDLLYPIEHLRPAIDIPLYHHEKWDGTGYPKGLKGEESPLAARIFSVVDVWDALCSDRPYRPGWPKEKVREYIRSNVGTQFDAGVVEMFLRLDLSGDKKESLEVTGK
ncbi:MAG: PAS domain S-box protein [Nitrospiraceae bacterium]|nr:MAG: PAS domain S-box protein [Nitrospiraceae bacterium]